LSAKGIHINIVVEGQTEETFVRQVLADDLGSQSIFITSRSVQTGAKHGKIYRGGLGRGNVYDKLKRDVKKWLSQHQSAFVTTMIDLYALPKNFPGFDDAQKILDPYEKVRALENEFAADINNLRFIPYIQLHEFEGLLFSDVQVVDQVLALQSVSQLPSLKDIRANFPSPEQVDDGENTAPSKRLVKLFPGYDKTAFGPLIAERIGLEIIRRECSHFNEWLTKLETLE